VRRRVEERPGWVRREKSSEKRSAEV